MINMHIYQLMHIYVGIRHISLWVDIIHMKNIMVSILYNPCTLKLYNQHTNLVWTSKPQCLRNKDMIARRLFEKFQYIHKKFPLKKSCYNPSKLEMKI
jgi:hypothetical protein